MNVKTFAASVLPLGALLLLASGPNAYAYVDPGTGGLLIQALFAGIAGAAVAFRAFRHKLASLFGRGKPADKDGEN